MSAPVAWPSTTGLGRGGQLRRLNRGGYAQAAGRSAIWTSDGVVSAQAGPETGAIADATLS